MVQTYHTLKWKMTRVQTIFDVCCPTQLAKEMFTLKCNAVLVFLTAFPTTSFLLIFAFQKNALLKKLLGKGFFIDQFRSYSILKYYLH